jgi:hypothetical protein
MTTEICMIGRQKPFQRDRGVADVVWPVPDINPE